VIKESPPIVLATFPVTYEPFEQVPAAISYPRSRKFGLVARPGIDRLDKDPRLSVVGARRRAYGAEYARQRAGLMTEDNARRFAGYGGCRSGSGEDCGTGPACLMGARDRGWSAAVVVWECWCVRLLAGEYDGGGVDEHAAGHGRQRGLRRRRDCDLPCAMTI
jgi:hypothetical protein